jgi:glycosyltransferase 2 family protein
MLPRRVVWTILRALITLGFAAYVGSKIDLSVFSQVLPSSVGGDVVRVFKVHREGLSTGVAATTVLLERLAALAAVLLAVAFSVPALIGMVRIPGFALGMASIFVASVFGFAFLFAGDVSDERLLRQDSAG